MPTGIPPGGVYAPRYPPRGRLSRIGDTVQNDRLVGPTIGPRSTNAVPGKGLRSMSNNIVALVIGGLVCLVLVLIVGWALAAYNRLVRQRNQVDASWAQIDVQLKRRYDLIPNLVETVKGYAAHERGTLDAVV